MDHQTLEQFYVIGIAIRTTNENGQSGKDIPALWNTFMTEDVANKIPHKIDSSIYCMYTDYEKDHTKPYTTILGCRVTSLEEVPEGMMGKTVEEAKYIKYVSKGNTLQGVVFDTWVNIWNSDLPRAFTTDFEVYGEKAQNPEDAEVDIFIAVK